MASAITQQIINQLDQLPLELQRKVIDFMQALVISLPKGVPGKQLLRFAGEANVKKHLEQVKGRPIPENDVWIAAIARQ